MQFDKHIFLTGFMGCGKTTISKHLANQLKIDVIDLDAFIEQLEDTTIQQIFNTNGEAYFRELETNYLKKILQLKSPCVISLGGGTICFNENLQLVKQNGILLYIDLPIKNLFQRLNQPNNQRPLLNNLKDDDLRDFISLKLEERKPYYEQAHIKLNGLKISPHSIAFELIDFQKKDN